MIRKPNDLLVAIVAAAGIFLTGCGSAVHVEKDKTARLANYRTYSWLDQIKVEGTKSRHVDLIQSNVRDAVNEQLRKKGWVQTQSDPDMLVSTDLLIEKSVVQRNDPVYTESYTRSYYNSRTGRYNTFYFPSQFMGYDSYNEPVKKGTITITMVDSKTDRTFWQAWTTTDLDNGNITSDEIAANVKTIFKKFKPLSNALP